MNGNYRVDRLFSTPSTITNSTPQNFKNIKPPSNNHLTNNPTASVTPKVIKTILLKAYFFFKQFISMLNVVKSQISVFPSDLFKRHQEITIGEEEEKSLDLEIDQTLDQLTPTTTTIENEELKKELNIVGKLSVIPPLIVTTPTTKSCNEIKSIKEKIFKDKSTIKFNNQIITNDLGVTNESVTNNGVTNDSVTNESVTNDLIVTNDSISNNTISNDLIVTNNQFTNDSVTDNNQFTNDQMVSNDNSFRLFDWFISSVPNDPEETNLKCLKWIIVEGICGVGDNVNNSHVLRQSSRIVQVSNKRLCQSFTGSEYQLAGPMNTSQMSEFSESFKKKFKDGFPANWKSCVLKELNGGTSQSGGNHYSTTIKNCLYSKSVDDLRKNTANSSPSSPIIVTTTKSGRKSVKPVEFWNNVYKKDALLKVST